MLKIRIFVLVEISLRQNSRGFDASNDFVALLMLFVVDDVSILEDAAVVFEVVNSFDSFTSEEHDIEISLYDRDQHSLVWSSFG